MNQHTENANCTTLDELLGQYEEYQEPINSLCAYYIGRLTEESFSVIQNEDAEVLLFLSQNTAEDFVAEHELDDCFIHGAPIGNIRRTLSAYLFEPDLHLSKIG